MSFAILLFLLVVIATRVQLDYGATLRAIAGTNLGLYGLAFIAFYCSFVVRAVRWQVLLRNTGEANGLRTLFPIVILAFFANCVLPAKMGDFYRAFLLRQRTSVSASKGLGTIVSERVIDFLVLMGLLVISGLLSFQTTVPARFLRVFQAGLVVSFGLVLGLVAVRYSPGRILHWLPVHLRDRAARFKGGLLDTFQARVPLIIGLSLLVWVAESSRLYLVVQALPLHVSLTVAQIMFIALVASLLTTVPALPGGLVLVEGGIIAVLAFFGLTPSQGLSVAILDRLISYWSLVAVGLAVFVFSRQR